jgi:hypothetical protein
VPTVPRLVIAAAVSFEVNLSKVTIKEATNSDTCNAVGERYELAVWDAITELRLDIRAIQAEYESFDTTPEVL